jgi:uncharacterized protein YndB with AHSA1/START domain/uncharacterized protein YciI
MLRPNRAYAFILAGYLGLSAAVGDDAPAPIRVETVVDAPRQEVWQAWTTTEGITTFFAANAEIEMKPGGAFEIYFSADSPVGSRGSEGCKVLSWVDQEMLAFSWNAPPTFENVRTKRTFVVLQFSDVGAGKTRIRLTNDGYQTGEEWEKAHAYFTKAWPSVLEACKQRFADGPRWPESERMTLRPSEQKGYAYFIRPSREGFFDGPTDEEKEVIGRHAAYIRDLLGQGRLVVAGPCFDPVQYPDGADSIPFKMETPGIVVFEASGDDEAREIMESDPAVAAGVFKACVTRMSLSFVRP